MDIKDFQGLLKYKLVAPMIYCLNWIFMVIGPIYFEEGYQKFCIFVLVYANLKVIMLFCFMVIIIYKSRDVFQRIKDSESEPTFQHENIQNSIQEVYYGFILPSYKEDIEMIAETLDVLASHERSKNKYLIFLAMEAHEQNSDVKAMELIKRYKKTFRAIDFTRHEIRKFEQKGKASNVSWCAENLEPIFEKYQINPDSVFLTILDADSWAPNVYFEIMQEHITKNFANRHKYIYQPPQIFTRNNMDVPILTRVYDIMHSFAHCANLYSFFDLTFPLSNYTLSYNLIKRIGFWDTCPDAIGEDFHTTQKAYWKTGGDIETVPIYAPFNQVNISTGNGWIEDVLARFWQAERHAQGVADLAWEFKMLFTHKFKPMNFVVWFQIFETFVMPGVMPWVFISLFLQSNVLYFNREVPENLHQPIVATILFNMVSVLSTAGYFLYEYFKRKSNRIIYKRENESIWRAIEYPLSFVANLFFISVPTFVLAAFGSLNADREYVVAEKKNAVQKH